MQTNGYLLEDIELEITPERLRSRFGQQALDLLREIPIRIGNMEPGDNIASVGGVGVRKIVIRATPDELKWVDVTMEPLGEAQSTVTRFWSTQSEEIAVRLVERKLVGTKVIVDYKGVRFIFHM
jgi:hypothetical protein